MKKVRHENIVEFIESHIVKGKLWVPLSLVLCAHSVFLSSPFLISSLADVRSLTSLLGGDGADGFGIVGENPGGV